MIVGFLSNKTTVNRPQTVEICRCFWWILLWGRPEEALSPFHGWNTFLAIFLLPCQPNLILQTPSRKCSLPKSLKIPLAKKNSVIRELIIPMICSQNEKFHWRKRVSEDVNKTYSTLGSTAIRAFLSQHCTFSSIFKPLLYWTDLVKFWSLPEIWIYLTKYALWQTKILGRVFLDPDKLPS